MVYVPLNFGLGDFLFAMGVRSLNLYAKVREFCVIEAMLQRAKMVKGEKAQNIVQNSEITK